MYPSKSEENNSEGMVRDRSGGIQLKCALWLSKPGENTDEQLSVFAYLDHRYHEVI